MSVVLSDKQYDTVRQALTAIAKGLKETSGGWSRRLFHHEINLLARDACDTLGWPYMPGGEKATARQEAQKCEA